MPRIFCLCVSLLNGGLVLAQNSVASSTQRTYNSTWKKWIVFMQTCNHNPTAASINCTQTSHDHLLQLLLMFISYCVDTINKAPTSRPGIMSALRYQFNMSMLAWQLLIWCVSGMTALRWFLAVQSPLHWNQLYWSTSDPLTNAIRTQSEGSDGVPDV